MDTQELLVHECSQREAVKRIHTRVVHLLRVFDFTWDKRQRQTPRETTIPRAADTLHHHRGRGTNGGILTFLFEGEVFSQMSTFMISTQ